MIGVGGSRHPCASGPPVLLVLVVRSAPAFLPGFVLPVRIALDGNDVGVVGKPVDQCRCGRGVWKYGPPVSKRQIGSQYDGFDFVSSVDELEKDVRGGVIVCQVSKFVDHQKRRAAVMPEAPFPQKGSFLATDVRDDF